jgi:Cu/Ag efflux pump CusA
VDGLNYSADGRRRTRRGYPQDDRSSIDRLKSLLITSPTGVTVPLKSVATVEMEELQTEVHRDNPCNDAVVENRGQ